MSRRFRNLFVNIIISSLVFLGITQSAQAALGKYGITSEEAQARTTALTDAEAVSVAQQIDALPAGGDGVVGALIFIFVLLLVTDILGLTKIFPFTRSVRH